MELFFAAGISLCLLLLLIILLKINRANTTSPMAPLHQHLATQLKENRQELSGALKENRQELSGALDRLTRHLEERLNLLNEGTTKNAKATREELTQTLNYFQESFVNQVKEFNELQKQKFDAMAIKQDDLVKATEHKLEKMREMVEEKLHKTLEERLGQSFRIVSERLEAVQKGLGEMQHLANGVGDLKRVLSNVKTRGVLGEIQLSNILEQIMAPEQYASNIKTKKGSNDLVEFAIKLPGKEDFGQEVYLPIDAKFPQEDYIRLQKAYDQGDIPMIETNSKALAQSVKKFARDIHQKYIDPPYTTDFGIMFLPLEGLYAEVVRQPELVATLQREFKIIVTGPTTLAAMLNSLQMGFKTLAIQKRSSEVWHILGAVKTEFGKFGSVLDKARKKIDEANRELDRLVTTRTRMMLSKLKDIEELPAAEVSKLLETKPTQNTQQEE